MKKLILLILSVISVTYSAWSQTATYKVYALTLCFHSASVRDFGLGR